MILRAPLPANVFRVEIKVGDIVMGGERLVVLESMKMEIPISAAVAGTVRAVMVSEGQSVLEDEALVDVGVE